jgi:hypothetical protein
VRRALDGKTVTCDAGRICPADRKGCGYS